MAGRVKWFNDQKGFGFISLADSHKDAFVHHSAIQQEGFKRVTEGACVEFDVVEGAKGPAAENVVELAACPEGVPELSPLADRLAAATLRIERVRVLHGTTEYRG